MSSTCYILILNTQVSPVVVVVTLNITNGYRRTGISVSLIIINLFSMLRLVTFNLKDL